MPTNQEMIDAVEAELLRIAGAPSETVTETACQLEAAEMVSGIAFDADGYAELIAALQAVPDGAEAVRGYEMFINAGITARSIAETRGLKPAENPNPEDGNKPEDTPDP